MDLYRRATLFLSTTATVCGERPPRVNGPGPVADERSSLFVTPFVADAAPSMNRPSNACITSESPTSPGVVYPASTATPSGTLAPSRKLWFAPVPSRFARPIVRQATQWLAQ